MVDQGLVGNLGFQSHLIQPVFGGVPFELAAMGQVAAEPALPDACDRSIGRRWDAYRGLGGW